jgi:hypothetical protein
MKILQHRTVSITMKIYTEVPDASTACTQPAF